MKSLYQLIICPVIIMFERIKVVGVLLSLVSISVGICGKLYA